MYQISTLFSSLRSTYRIAVTKELIGCTLEASAMSIADASANTTTLSPETSEDTTNTTAIPNVTTTTVSKKERE